jgi:hypothetical protein
MRSQNVTLLERVIDLFVIILCENLGSQVRDFTVQRAHLLRELLLSYRLVLFVLVYNTNEIRLPPRFS